MTPLCTLQRKPMQPPPNDVSTSAHCPRRLQLLCAHISAGGASGDSAFGRDPADDDDWVEVADGANAGPGDSANTRHRGHTPGTTPKWLASKEWCNRVLNMHELVPLARQALDAGTWSYLRSGADTETTVRRNRLALDSLALEQGILNDVSQIDPSTTVFGKDLAMPIITAPMGNVVAFDQAHCSARDVAAGQQQKSPP